MKRKLLGLIIVLAALNLFAGEKQDFTGLMDSLLYVTPNGWHRISQFDPQNYSVQETMEREGFNDTRPKDRLLFLERTEAVMAFLEFVDYRYERIEGNRSFFYTYNAWDYLQPGLGDPRYGEARPENLPREIRERLIHDFNVVWKLIQDPENLAVIASLPGDIRIPEGPGCCDNFFRFLVFRNDGTLLFFDFNYSD